MGIMEWLVAAITASLFCAAVGADISSCDDGWRSMNGRCVASSTALGRLGGEGSAEGFLGARGKCDLQGASLLVITLADIPDLLASSETDDKEIYYWIGGVADQGKLSKYSQTVKVREDPDDADDGRDLCWAACFRSINNFVELTKASCQMKLNYLCERRFETDDCREASCAQGLKQRVRREVGQDPFRNVFSDPLNLGFGSINAIRNRVPIRFNPGSFQFPPHLAPITPNPMGITFPTFIGKLHPLIVVPDHQGGVVHRLDTLFASDRGDRSNLITVQPPVTPRTKSPSKGDDMDYTSSPPAVESGKVGAVTPRSERKFSLRIPAGAIPIIHDQYNGAANAVNVRTNLSFALPSASTQQAFARTTRTLEIVTQPTVVQFTTNNVNQAIRDASDKNAKGCLRNDHRFFKGSCYALIEKLESFMGGLQACLSLSALGHSVVINDKAEDDFLRPTYMDKRASVWLGLHRRTSNSNARDAFYWIDNTPVTYSNWALHEPAKIKDCVYASFYSGRGLWFTEDCDKPLYMLCEYPRSLNAIQAQPAVQLPPSKCAKGWRHFAATKSCYKLMAAAGATQAISERNCQLYGGHLVSIASQEEANFIQSLVSDSDFAYTTFWVGLVEAENGTGHEWLDGTPPEYLRWRVGQPDSHLGRQKCVTVYKKTMEMSDTYCEAYFASMCEAPEDMSQEVPQPITAAPAPACPDPQGWKQHKDNCYQVYSMRDGFFKTWDQARLFCRANRAELASVLNDEENAFLMSLVYTVPDTMLWLGGTAGLGGGYRWTDASPFTYINWRAGEPNDLQSQESCLGMYPKLEAHWNDDNCGRLAGWVCKKSILENPSVFVTLPTTSSAPVGNCETGWLNTGTKCIKLFEEAKPFDEARGICKQEGPMADLVSVASEKEQAYVSTLLGTLETSVWLGMKYVDVYRWLDQTPVTYTNWAPGEPNNNHNPRNGLPEGVLFRLIHPGPVGPNSRGDNGVLNPVFPSRIFWHKLHNSLLPNPGREKRSADSNSEDCVEMHEKFWTNQWNDAECHISKPFVCQKPLDSSLEEPSPPLLCSPPFQNYIQYSSACYRYEETALPWQEADLQCRDEGAVLASVDYMPENSFLYLMANSAGESGASNIWIGFHYDNTSERFEWSDGRPALFTNWAPGEGATGATGALREEASRCVELSTQRPGAWAAKSCDEAKPFICKYENVTAPTLDPAVTGRCPSKDWVDFGSSFCYLVNANDQFTWAKANSQCEALGASLVSVHSALEMKHVTRLTAVRRTAFWTGLIRGQEAEFLWSDGTAFDFLHWAPEEPNSQSEKCVEMFSGKGEWNDISCDVLRGYICKTNKKPLSETTSLIAAAETSEHLSHRQDQVHLSSGSVVALVVVSLVMTAALGYVVYTYVNHLRVSRPTHRPAAITSFDNALYNPDALENSILESMEDIDGRCHSVTLSLGRS